MLIELCAVSFGLPSLVRTGIFYFIFSPLFMSLREAELAFSQVPCLSLPPPFFFSERELFEPQCLAWGSVVWGSAVGGR